MVVCGILKNHLSGEARKLGQGHQRKDCEHKDDSQASSFRYRFSVSSKCVAGTARNAEKICPEIIIRKRSAKRDAPKGQ
jgi:hypothetical protein